MPAIPLPCRSRRALRGATLDRRPHSSGDTFFLRHNIVNKRICAYLVSADGAVAWCGTLANAATAHSQDMAANGFLSHIGSDGSDFVVRANRHGYRNWTWITENLAHSVVSTSVDAVLASWMGSGAHAANVLDRRIQHAGFARVGNAWTQMFGAGGTC